MKKLLSALLLAAGVAHAASEPLDSCKIANLSACAGQVPGTVAYVIDGTDASDCTVGGGTTQHLCLLVNTGWTAVGSGTGGTPGGANTQVQFNDSGAFGGDAGLTYDKTGDDLLLSGTTASVKVDGIGASFEVEDSIVGYIIDPDGSSGGIVAFGSTVDPASGTAVADFKDALSGQPNTIAFTERTQTLTAKTIDGDDNTVRDLSNSAIKAAAAIDATKLAYAGGATIGSGTVEAAIDELSDEKLDTADAIPGWPFTMSSIIWLADPDSGSSDITSPANPTCLQTVGSATSIANCFGGGTIRNHAFSFPSTATVYVHDLTCTLDGATGPNAGDVLTISVVSGVFDDASVSTIGSAITFTQGTDFVYNTVKRSTIDSLVAASEKAIAIRAELTDADSGITNIYLYCRVSGYID